VAAPGEVPAASGQSRTAGRSSGGGRDVLGELARRPGGRELLAAAGTAELALVGGAVRDLLRGREPRELDVVAGPGADIEQLAAELASQLGATAVEPTHHERFGTALVEWEGGRIDIARRRAESYPQPGALPVVRDGSVEEDLVRRDFTVNAIAVPLAGPRSGELLAPAGALADLEAGRLRVLHDESFRDDPTRLLRLARYRARLGFEVEPHTGGLAARALADGALDTVSGTRVGAEVRLALAEPDPLSALATAGELGILAAIDSSLDTKPELAQRALALLPDGASPTVVLLASLLPQGEAPDARGRARSLLDRLEFSAGERDTALESAAGAPALAAAIASARRPSELYAALAGRPPEAVALAGATGDGAAEQGARDWLQRLSHVRLQINGDDLLAAGVPAGPELGARLLRVLHQRLDGDLPDGREAELRAALEGPT
jgi:tRNA nucleotidyltransferase (CCA-adding enzyme)